MPLELLLMEPSFLPVAYLKKGALTLLMPKGRGFLVATESVSADQFVSDRSYPKLGLCHQPS